MASAAPSWPVSITVSSKLTSTDGDASRLRLSRSETWAVPAACGSDDNSQFNFDLRGGGVTYSRLAIETNGSAQAPSQIFSSKRQLHVLHTIFSDGIVLLHM